MPLSSVSCTLPSSSSRYVNPRSSGLSLFTRPPIFASSRVYSKSEMKEKEKEKRGKERDRGEDQSRGKTRCARANRSCRLYLTLQTGGRRRAGSLFYCRVGREECVWLKFQSRPSAFSAESREKENRSTGDNNDESVRLGGRETNKGEDQMPRVFPPTYRSRPLSKRLAKM